MKKSGLSNILLLGAAALLGYWLMKKASGGMHGLGDADPQKLDISKDEDLCNFIANCLGAEQHLCSSAALPNGEKFIAPLQKMREMRREAMAKLLPADAEGQTWCLVKHLLASSMHAREVGDKLAAQGQAQGAKPFYEQSEELKKSAIAMSATAKAGGQCPVCKGG